ncbi:MAG: TVP38/TMEM64 family protein [Oscillospiraceae bacterium]
MKPAPQKKKGPLSKLLRPSTVILVLGLVLVLVLFYVLFSGITVQDILSFTPQNLVLAALVFVGLYCLKTVLMFFPSYVLYISTGFVFPPALAILITYIGLFCEFTLGYLIGRRAGSARVQALIGARPKAAAFFAFVQRNGQFAYFFTRLVPMPVPLDAVSLFFGASAAPYLRYISFSLLGISALMLPCVLAGAALDRPFSLEFLLPFGISIAVTVGVYLLQRALLGRGKATAPPEDPPEE